MAKIVTEFEYDLSNPISYHKGGDLAKGKKLLLKAPSNAHRFHLIKLKQGFLKSMLGISQQFSKKSSGKSQAQAEDSADAALNHKTILTFLLASDIDFYEYLECFKNLLCSEPSLCFIDGSVPLNAHTFDQLSEEDSELLLGKYIENFTLSSWMNLLGTK